MSSTYTRNNGFEKLGIGEQTGTWGNTENTSSDLLDVSLDGVANITLVGPAYTLNVAQGSDSLGRNRVIVFGGGPGATCTVTITPNTAQKLYFVVNNTNQTIIVAQGNGSTVSIPSGAGFPVNCDGGGVGASVARVILLTTDQVAEGSLRQYFTVSRAQQSITVSGSILTYSGGALGTAIDTTKVPEGVTNLYYTDARSRGAITVSGSGTYNPSTGVINITGGGGGGGTVNWGGIGGTLTSQNDLSTALNLKATSSSLSTLAFTGAWGDVTGKPSFSSVATSGAYGDLSGRPSLATVATTGSASDLATGSLALSRIAQSGATANQVMAWNGSAWTPATAGGGMKSVQRGSTVNSFSGNSITADVTIAAVTMSKAYVVAYGLSVENAFCFSAELTTSTNLHLSARTSNGAASSAVTWTWEVVEFN